MFSSFIDRISGKPNRYKVVPENGDEPYYVVLERADEPITPGTQLNADTLNNLAMEHVKDKNSSGKLSFWVGTQAEYEALSEPPINTFVIITDDTSVTDLENKVNALGEILFDDYENGFGNDSTYPLSLVGFGKHNVIIAEVEGDNYNYSGQFLLTRKLDGGRCYYTGSSIVFYQDDTTASLTAVYSLNMEGYEDTVDLLTIKKIANGTQTVDENGMKIRRIISLC